MEGVNFFFLKGTVRQGTRHRCAVKEQQQGNMRAKQQSYGGDMVEVCVCGGLGGGLPHKGSFNSFYRSPGRVTGVMSDLLG